MYNPKEKIIEMFNKNVKDQAADTDGANQRHDGKKGHWLERQFGIDPNKDTAPDLYGYELKNETAIKTTFGDWSANIYIFKKSEHAHLFKGKSAKDRQNSFLRMFGQYNANKGRHSWSGTPFPKINQYNDFGQTIVVENNDDITIYYSYEKDKRANKSEIVPAALRTDTIVLAKWFGRSFPNNFEKTKRCTTLSQKLEQKFDDQGWFTCKTNDYGIYTTICFGRPMNYSAWIELVKIGVVFLDSGMYEGNPRPYANWRANNAFWDSLIEDCH